MGRPLAQQRVVVTRAEHQAAGLLRAFEEAGAEAVALPLLEVVPPADLAPLEEAAREAAGFSWIAFTSANAVSAFLERLPADPSEVLAGGPAVAAVGRATARVLEAAGLEVELIASDARAEGLLAALAVRLQPGQRVLLPQAADARPVLAEGLRAAGADLTAVTAYAKRLPPEARARAEGLYGSGPLGWVTFSSPRIARAFAEVFGGLWPRRRGSLKAASIGPVTSAALRRLGVEPKAEAAEPSDGALVAAVVAAQTVG